MSDITLKEIRSGYNLSKINDNFGTIEEVINDEVVHTTGGNNVMSQDLDMNSNDILNLPEPTEPTNPVRLIDLQGLVDPVGEGLVMVKYSPSSIAEGQTEFTMEQDFGGIAVYINGRYQNDLSGAYVVVDRTVVLSEPLSPEDDLVFILGVFPVGVNTGDPVGSHGNPYLFDTVDELKESQHLFKLGDWLETKGKDKALDGRNAKYLVVSNESATSPDGFYILNLGDKKGVLMYTAPTGVNQVDISDIQLKGYWGSNTHPVANSKKVGGLTTYATAFVNKDGMFVGVQTGNSYSEALVSTSTDASQSPAIEWSADGSLVAFHATGSALFATKLLDGVAQSPVSVSFPADIKDIQVHRVHNSTYVFVATESNGLWFSNYLQGAFTTPVQFSDFETMRSKSMYEDDTERTVAPTIKFMFADNPSDTTNTAYYAEGVFVPTVDGLGSLEFRTTAGSAFVTITPSTTSGLVSSSNAELVFTASGGNTVYLGDISREELPLLALAEMPTVTGLETFNLGYAYDLTLVHFDSTNTWVTETVTSVVGLEGFDAFAPQTDSTGATTGSFGIEGKEYKPLGICFADLAEIDFIEPLSDQRKVCYVSHAGGTYDLRTYTVTTDGFVSGANTIASDNPRIVVRDNNKPIYRPKHYLNSEKVKLAYVDSDSLLSIDSSEATVGTIDTAADVQAIRDSSPVTSLLTEEEAARLVDDGSIGPSGGSWWVYPTTIGRQEGGQDVVYVGGTYGVADNSRDDGLAIKGTAVQFVASMTWDEDNNTYVLDKRQLLNKFIVDEHDNPAISFQKPNGEMVISSNSHADSIDEIQEWSTYTFGKDIRTLSPLTVAYHRSRSTYSQLLSSRSTSWHVHRVNNAGWGFSRLTQNGFPEGYSQMLATPHNYYVSFAELDKETTQGAGAVNKYHCFIAANPIDDEKADIKYLQGEFEVGSGIVLRNAASAKVFAMSGNEDPISDTDFDVAVSEDASTRRVRLLDIAYREEPRILYQSMPKSDDLINRTYVDGQRISVKDVEFSDLKMAWNNGGSWQNVVIKSNIQGGLGWDPLGDVNGVTYNANAYFYGGCFHAGADHTASLDTIYFVWKNPDDTYEMRSINFNATTGAVSNEQTIYGPTRKILYRPKMTQGGNRRVLFFYEADDWWSYTTYSAVTRFIDLTV